MKTKELNQMTVTDLRSRLSELRKDLVKNNAQVALGANIKNSKAIHNFKKEIAKILTILTEKEGRLKSNE